MGLFRSLIRRCSRCRMASLAFPRTNVIQFRPCLEVLEDRVVPDSSSWNPGVKTGSWSAAGSWLNGVPGPNNTAFFNLPGVTNVSLAAKTPVTIANLFVRGDHDTNNSTILDLKGENLTATNSIQVGSNTFALQGVAGPGTLTLNNTGGNAATVTTNALNVGFTTVLFPGDQKPTPAPQNIANLIVNAGQGVTVNVGGTINIGGKLVGTLKVDGTGAKITATTLNIGGVSGVPNRPNITGATNITSATISNGAQVTISGLTTLGGYNNYAPPRLGAQPPRGSTLLQVIGDNSKLTTDKLHVGGPLKSILNVTAGATIQVNKDMEIGKQGFDATTVTVSGAKGNPGTLNVKGPLDINQGATLAIQANGIANVAGTISNNTGGTLNVLDQGHVKATVAGVNFGNLNVAPGTWEGPQLKNQKKMTLLPVAPGAGAGEFNVQGNFVQTATGDLNVNLNGATAGTGYDVLEVSPGSGTGGSADPCW